MGQDRKTHWREAVRGRVRAGGALVGATLSLAMLAGPAMTAPQLDQGALEQVIVRGFDGESAALEQAVEGSGGTVQRHLGLIHAVVAQVPAHRLAALGTVPGVLGVTQDVSVDFLNDDNHDGIDDAWADSSGPAEYLPSDDYGSLYNATKITGAQDAWSDGWRGQGIGVALIDSGVVPVDGLQGAGKVRNGADLSFDSQADNLAYLDGYGHGTHMAGIIAGRSNDVPRGSENDSKLFVGVAPDAHLINVKVGASDGAVDVSQVIAAIDWVVEHRNDAGMNIRVLNLSFGTDGIQAYGLDPLSYAVEVAWRAGIVVVVSAGNSGLGTPQLNNPALNPFVIAVGAADHRGTGTYTDDVVPAFSSRGDAARRVDLVAPGRLVSLRSPGSQVDNEAPGARVGGRFFRGSGTSQAAAFVSGSAAVLLSQRPRLTPDQVKRLLVITASPMPAADRAGRGSGMVNVKAALLMSRVSYRQAFAPGTGTGSLQQARGTQLISQAGVDLIGEYDIFGMPWDARAWAARAASGDSWTGGTWNGHVLTGTGWTGTSFASQTWQRAAWREASWARAAWRNEAWLRAAWRSDGWYDGNGGHGPDWGDGWLRAAWRNQGWQ